jgi:hypothetical protein
MPSLANVIGSIVAAIAVSLVFLLWIGWPGFVAVGTGAIFGVAFLIVATSLGDDPRAADEAWRAQAADLGGPAGLESSGEASDSSTGPDPDPERPS